MPSVQHLLLPLSYLLLLVSMTSAATSFCKCTCGSNSTIIPLDAPSSTFSSSFTTRSLPQSLVSALYQPEQRSADAQAEEKEEEEEEEQEASRGRNRRGEEEPRGSRRKTCMDCNKQYCLSQHLHICEGKAAEEVFTACFQRDSRKDEAVVFIFIAATAGLLGWAAVKPWVGRWIANARVRRMYVAVRGEGGEGEGEG